MNADPKTQPPETSLDAGPRTNAELREEATGRMVETAIRLIARHGASKLSLVDVGRESGYSHSLPNYYFKTKARLLLEVYDFIIGRFKKSAQAWNRNRLGRHPRPGLENIEATIHAYLGLASAEPTRSRALNVLWAESFSSMPELLEEVRPSNASTLSFLEDQLRIGIRRGEIRADIDVESMAVILIALLRGTVSQSLIEPGRVDLARVCEAVLGLLRQGVAVPTETVHKRR